MGSFSYYEFELQGSYSNNYLRLVIFKLKHFTVADFNRIGIPIFYCTIASRTKACKANTIVLNDFQLIFSNEKLRSCAQKIIWKTITKAWEEEFHKKLRIAPTVLIIHYLTSH